MSLGKEVLVQGLSFCIRERREGSLGIDFRWLLLRLPHPSSAL
jgi:hypothetical protein